MPRMPASWNAQVRSAAKHALVTLVVVCLLLAFINAKEWAIAGLLVPLLGLAAAYLLLIGLPFTLGRALKTVENVPAAVPVLLYLSWGGLMAWTLASNSVDVLFRCAASLPRYLDLHGYFAVSTLIVCATAFQLVRRTPVRVEDAFSLAPSAALGLAMALDGYLYAKVPFSDDLNLLTAEAYHGATAFLAMFAAVTVGLYASWRLRE